MEPARTAPAAAHDHRPSAAEYERRRPEGTVLHQVVSEHWGAFVEHAEEQGRPLPSFVQREVEAYLRCGMLEHGLLRLGCPACGFERLVAFSCKKRGFCPSCLGRRMTDTACHLRERVLPAVPLRQWVCSLPWELRLAVGYHGALCSAVVSALVGEVQRSYRWRAKRHLGLRSVELAHSGAVTFIQRFDPTRCSSRLSFPGASSLTSRHGASPGPGCSSTSSCTTFRSAPDAKDPPPGSRSPPSPTPSTMPWSTTASRRIEPDRLRRPGGLPTPSSPCRSELCTFPSTTWPRWRAHLHPQRDEPGAQPPGPRPRRSTLRCERARRANPTALAA